MNFLAGFKKFTHAIAVGIAAGAAWIVANPQIVESVVNKYPKAAVITTAAGAILALYHAPKSST